MYRDIKSIKRDILQKFRSLIEYDRRSLPPLWLHFYRFGSLKHDEQHFFDKAVKDLIAKGLLRRTEGNFPNLALTQKGFKLIQER